MSTLPSKSNVDNVSSKPTTEIDINNIHLSLEMGKSRSRSRMMLCSEILQSMMQDSDNIIDSLQEVTAKILNILHAVHVSIYQLDKSANTHERTKFWGKVIAEAIAPYCEDCSRVDIENILIEEYQCSQSVTNIIIDRYTAGLNRCEVNLAEIFTGKAYLLVPIVISEAASVNPLWGFLTVHQCTGLENGSFQGLWDQDDVLMLQQIAMQIEMSLQKINDRHSLATQLAEADQAYAILYRWTQQYRSLVEQIPSVSYVLPITNNPELAYISPQMQELLGVPASEWNAGFLNTWADYIHPDDRDRVYQDVCKTITSEEPFCCEYRMIRCDGTIIWVRDTARIGLAIDGKTKVLRGSTFDISDRKESELRFKGIFNNTFQFTGLLSIDGILLEANQTALDFGGVTRDEVIDKPFWEAYWFSISEDTQTRLRESVKRAAQGEFIRYETDIYGADQVVITIDFSIRPLKDESGQVVLLIPEGRDISELKAIEKTLRQSEARLAEAQRVAKLGNWEWNLLADKIIGSDELFNIFDRDPALGSLSYEEVVTIFDEEDRENLAQLVNKAKDMGESYRLELRVRQSNHSDHSYRYIEVIGHAERDDHGKVRRLYGTVQDISDRKLAEAKLYQNKKLLKLTIANVPVGIATFNLESEFLTVNQGFCKIFGYPEAELLKMTFSELTHPNALEKTLTALYRLLANEVTSIKVEKQYIHKNGHAIDVISRFGLVRDENGKPIQFVVGVEDVTERKQTEAKLAAAQVVESANKAKSEFLAVMSHELRTPMNAVIGMTEILENTPLSPQQQQYVSTIRNGGQVLLSVINNILDFSRIESEQFELEISPFKLEQCIEEVLDLMTSRTIEKSLELSAMINPDVPQQFLGDYNRLRQILVNLVSNAIKFTEVGEIAITVDARLIEQETNTYELLVDVHDTGVGIAPEAIARLFKAFSQADSSISRQYGGTGLGLAICKQLCELMGGEIWVDSTLGEGSTFSFKIMVQAIASEPVAIAPELKGKRILTVNANSTIQGMISLYAQVWELIPQCAYSPTEALQILSESNFDAVLIDVQMVDSLQINGLELAQSIQEVFPDLKLVLLTSVNAIDNSLTIQFADCITKPISATKLYQSFINIFTRKESSSITHYQIPQNLNPSFAQSYPFNVLVAEDNPVNQQVLLLMLENLGCQAESVDNGQKAIAALERHTYDVVFMDIQMPIMDGLTATKGIRQLPHQNPWIIGLSANAFIESRESALLAGMNDYLTKPLQVENLIAALQKVPQQYAVEYHAHSLLSMEAPDDVLDLSTLANLEDSIGSQNLDNLILVYLEHSEQAIASMQEAFKKRDIVTVDSENHALKGGSGTFGAIKLLKFCQRLQSLCRTCTSNHCTDEQIEQIGDFLRNIEEEYSYVVQAFQLRNY